MIQKEDLERLLRNDVKLQGYVDQAFKEEFFKVKPEEKPEYNGVQLINSKVITSYLRQLLRNDLQYAPFEMVAMEQAVSEKITIQTDLGPFTFSLGGTIDRMECQRKHIALLTIKPEEPPRHRLISNNCSPLRKHVRTISSKLSCMPPLCAGNKH